MGYVSGMSGDDLDTPSVTRTDLDNFHNICTILELVQDKSPHRDPTQAISHLRPVRRTKPIARRLRPRRTKPIAHPTLDGVPGLLNEGPRRSPPLQGG